MPNLLSKLFASLIAIGVLLLAPTYQVLKKQEDIAYLNVDQTVTNFVENVRMKGFITPKMVEDFQQQLQVGNVLYDVEMVHKHKIYTPVYSNTSDLNSYTGEYKVDYEDFYWTQIKDYLYGNNGNGDIPSRVYKLEQGDYFQVEVKNKTKFKSTMLFDYLTFNLASDNDVVIDIPKGGMVLNEDY
ncbi:hypothetical protein PVA17_21135 [Lysinibacillus sp. CNPSo 3705]|uniref:hypothetical protein n=1 Tax=Lysinibacillus sp. CNPSo 3705 TaxID=3028148 RepID=UPI0023641441|nr:hypothetical protein [Lysinibacillus sp. CNPSo 3705]MDD1505229.1 hypothetical protein [Lysinibacillus sp. CNPSo 3705]